MGWGAKWPPLYRRIAVALLDHTLAVPSAQKSPDNRELSGTCLDGDQQPTGENEDGG